MTMHAIELRKPYLLINNENMQILKACNSLKDAQYERVANFQNIEMVYILESKLLLQNTIRIKLK